MIAQKLDAAIKVVCPIFGVSIGRPDDKSTWRIDFEAQATSQQRSAAQAVLAAFDPNAPELPDNNAALAERHTNAALDDMERAINAGDTAGALRISLALLKGK